MFLRTATLSPLMFARHLKAHPFVRLIDSASEDHLWRAPQIYSALWSSSSSSVFIICFTSSDSKEIVVVEFGTVTGQNLGMCHSVKKVELAFVYRVAIELVSMLPRLLLRLRQNFVDFAKATWLWRFVLHWLVLCWLLLDSITCTHCMRCMQPVASDVSRSPSVWCWRSCTGCQSLIVFSTRSCFWCLWYMTIAVPCI